MSFTVQVFSAFDAVPSSLRESTSFRTSSSSLFYSWEWFENLFNNALVHETEEPRFYFVVDSDQRPVVALFCLAQPSNRILRSMTNFYSLTYGTVVLQNNLAQQAILSLAEHIAQEQPRWQEIDLMLTQAQDQATTWFVKALKAQQFYINTYFQYENWFLKLNGEDFFTYYQSLSSKLRNTIKRKEKKLAKEHNYEIKLIIDGEELEQGINDFVTVYNQSWKKPEPFPDFMPSFIQLCAELGILRLGILSIDQQPVAAQLWITFQSTSIIYKLAYDENYKIYSVGSILSHFMFKHTIDVDKVTLIDYGIGSEAYKRDWMTEVEKIQGVEAFNMKTIKGMVMAGKQKVASLIKSR
ncbi:GNAT family N-acetyltransferase [Zooshikella harenae]|uniref:GNAT family N-acetyltransferase n=1 Tax=Zooshikella harenae TaxID=2827238 RepID=A0ABS5Z7A3_9GAMM|nr:GNAT family N-acetyltransferase [Zooshikella harenae]MBU2709927.1 GNAT family N-acetyltransferase [Zooshikella harenae]